MKQPRGQRIYLQRLQVKDVTPNYVNWLNDPEINLYLESRFTHYELESCREYVKHLEDSSTDYLFGIFLHTHNLHIGNIKLGNIHPHHLMADIGLLIGQRECWGQGYATEAICCLTNWAFEHLGLQKIEAGCYETNLGSLRAFLKAGYAVEGFGRNAVSSQGKRIGKFLLGRSLGDRVAD